MKRLALFILSYVLWLLLVWPVDPVTGGWLVQDIVAGVAVALVVTLVFREIPMERLSRLVDPRRYFWAVIYLIVFIYEVVKANIDVAYRILHPAMPIVPGIVKIRTKLASLAARTALANSITLTPGTMSVDLTEDGYLYIHWINVQARDVEGATKKISERFEWFLTRILE